jgi:uncharacterized protein YdeI (YjbR/CyaY-like superfamily)
MKKKAASLRRPIRDMPAFVRRALAERKLLERYRQRPAYQRNDYLSWIDGAKREGTKLKRLEQMLDELERGGVYMKMTWRPRLAS